MQLQVVLDLDETLVCAYETSSLPAVVLNQATEAGLKWFELECVSSDKVLCMITILYIIDCVVVIHVLCFYMNLLQFEGK